MTEAVLKNKKPNESKLLAFGFEKQNDEYAYLCNIVDGQMQLTVSVSPCGKISTELIDKSTDEEYVLHRVPDAQGSFVGQVKTEYQAILDEIVARCFDSEVFESKQAKAVITYVRDKYGDELEYLWEKFPDNAIVRRKDNQKWYAAILTVSRYKLGMDSDELVEILDLRMSSDDIEKIVDNKIYLPGYHMNKRHWFTICLDGTVSNEEIFTRIDESYDLARK